MVLITECHNSYKNSQSPLATVYEELMERVIVIGNQVQVAAIDLIYTSKYILGSIIKSMMAAMTRLSI